ncbi:MAG: integration host factor subunit alpha [Proteobacteria bacterium]|nr:integration host factor subunit alpha [Desulfobacteraceae bacterium]MBU4316589.1 integration host factor subunit alpha [Pseudomonadota bacterium]MBU4470837.1 integration host factor subunit alpha [Pseudomonadota bacterium]MCG2750965.1 integration host factor subunit alpha [Desulfobacteraceae bacterium]
MTVTRKHLADSIQEQTGISKNKSIELVETIIELISRTLENDEDVMISGFGKFAVKHKRQRKGRNPATGDDMMLEQRKVVTFKCSGKLREMLNDED